MLANRKPNRIPRCEAATEWGTFGLPSDPRLAKLLHVVETRSGVLRHALYLGGAHVPHHCHDAPVLVYGVGGPCIEHHPSTQIVKRRLTYHPTGFGHALDYVAATHVVAIELKGDMAEGWPDRSAPLLATLYDDVWRLLLTVAENAPRNITEQALLQLSRRAHACLASDAPVWFQRTVDDLHSTWQHVPSISEMADRAGVSPQHLCRAFRRHTGVTARHYGMALRVDHARGLLWGSGAPISEIAAATGFADQSHLTRALAQHSGRTPRRVRLLAPYMKRGRDLLPWLISGDEEFDVR